MYTTLNACRSYLYCTAKAVDRNIVSNKVYVNNIFAIHSFDEISRIVLVLYYIARRKQRNCVLMVYRFLVEMVISMIILPVDFYAMRNCMKLALVQVKFDDF